MGFKMSESPTHSQTESEVTPYVSMLTWDDSEEPTSIPEVGEFESPCDDVKPGILSGIVRALQNTLSLLRFKIGRMRVEREMFLMEIRRGRRAGRILKGKLVKSRVEARNERWKNNRWIMKGKRAEEIVDKLKEEFEGKLRQRDEDVQRLRNELYEAYATGGPEIEGPACCVCMRSPPTVVFLPCWHLAVCLSCSKLTGIRDRCPMCRTVPNQVVETFTP